MPIERKPEFFKGAQLKVGVIGCGYVGLPLGLRFAEAGHRVVGFDTDPSKVEKLNQGQSYIGHIAGAKIQQYVRSKHFSATNDFARLADMDAVVICVPTPLDQRHEPDLSYVEQTAQFIQPHLQRGQLIVLESTTYPGTTEELVLPILEANGLRCPIAHGPDAEHIVTDFFLAFSPEREDPGNKQFGLAQIPKVVGGVNPPSGRAAQALVRSGRVACRAGQFDARGGDGQAARKYLSLREYRAGERAEAAGPAHGHRYLGSDRCRGHQTLRLHALLSRARLGRPLHPGRSLLFVLEGARI